MNLRSSGKYCVASILFMSGILICFQISQNEIYTIVGKIISKHVKFDNEASRRNINCSSQEVQETGGFCIDINNIGIGGSNWMDGKVCRGIEGVVGESSVVDFGAGLGQYGRCLLRKLPTQLDNYTEQYKTFYSGLTNVMSSVGLFNKTKVIKSWEGYDGGLNAETVSENLVNYIDLSKPFDLKKRYDWVMSLEVGEHIPAQYEDIYIDNVVKHATKGIILSWAIPHQGGHNHVNCRPNKYIISKITEKGFLHDDKSQNILRKNVTYSYFANTLMVFRKS